MYTEAHNFCFLSLLRCGHVCATACVWRPEDKVVEPILCFCVYRSSRNHIQVKHLPLQSHLIPPSPTSFFLCSLFIQQGVRQWRKQTWAFILYCSYNSKIFSFLSPRSQRNQILWLRRISWHKQDLYQAEQVFSKKAKEGRISNITLASSSVWVREQGNG